MREIKFRVWDNQSNEYFKPIYEAYKGNLLDLSIGLGGDIIRRTLDMPAEHESMFPDRYLPEQYTGLKDKNGKEIYCGDIVFEIYQGKYTYVDTYKKEKLVSLVKQDIANPCMLLHRQNSSFDSDWEYDFVKCDMLVLEIIGNIHENKNLIK